MRLSLLQNVIEGTGAVAFGVAPLEMVEKEVMDEFENWLAQGKNAGMHYLENHLEIRRNPRLLLEDNSDKSPGSILSMAFPYYAGEAARPGALQFARYALGDDYHEVLRHRLQPVAEAILSSTGLPARICVDTAPILERYWAVKAGVGYIGDNHQLIVPGVGSHIFLAEIVTLADIENDIHKPDTTSECLHCGRCARACPNGALGADGFDARRCLSYLTIEHRGEFPEGVRIPSNRVYGCDLCLEACPLAKSPTTPAPLPEFEPRQEVMNLNAESLASLTPADFSRIFRHSAVKRAKLAGLLRNLATAKSSN